MVFWFFSFITSSKIPNMPWAHPELLFNNCCSREWAFSPLYPIPSIEWNENSRVREVYEFPQMCRLNFHTNTDDWDLFSEEVRRLVGVMACFQTQVQTAEPWCTRASSVARLSCSLLKITISANSIKNGKNFVTLPHAFPVFAYCFVFCLFSFSFLSVSLCLCLVSLILSAPEARGLMATVA